MEDKGLLMLARMVLPKEVFDHFIIVKIEYVDTKTNDEPEMHIHLDENMNVELQSDSHFESKGFIAPVEVTDFPIRDHKVVLVLRRRRWVDTRTGKSFVLPLKVTADGTRNSKEFAAFLKETYGEIPSDLPYA
ncbi:ISAon1 family transposase N-terminal region protein [Segatella bryantii]|uniref:ISAon1 family transposase N-terminal region protein n=1 Tax=Segatella bryantii TaxID=77095 RepID=UPI00241C8300|nr:hypothetical protein [Segatella bryantii]